MLDGPRAALIVGLTLLAGCDARPVCPARTSEDLPRPQPGIALIDRPEFGSLLAGQAIFVPITSSIATADDARPINLATTATICNLDREQPIIVRSIEFRDSGGKLVREHVDRAIRIDPLAAFDLFLAESDTSGGPSPSFVVDSGAEREPTTKLLVPAVMISTAGLQGITLTSTGQPIATAPR